VSLKLTNKGVRKSLLTKGKTLEEIYGIQKIQEIKQITKEARIKNNVNQKISIKLKGNKNAYRRNCR